MISPLQGISVVKLFSQLDEHCISSLGADAYQAYGEYPWSGYREMDRGFGVDLSVSLIYPLIVCTYHYGYILTY